MSITRGGIITNLDNNKLSEKERHDGNEADYAMGVVDEATKDAKKTGGASFAVYTEQEMADDKVQKITQNDIEKEIVAGIMDNSWVRPRRAVADPSALGGYVWDLTPDRLRAVENGTFCPNCLGKQRDTSIGQCHWEDAKYSHVTGCGFNTIANDIVRG